MLVSPKLSRGVSGSTPRATINGIASVLPPAYSNPAIAVIIPTHNRAQQLRTTLQSVFEQDLPAERYEVVVVANACTDETAEVVRGFQRPGLLVHLVDEPRLGLHYARHAGAKAASAPLLVYTDDDV